MPPAPSARRPAGRVASLALLAAACGAAACGVPRGPAGPTPVAAGAGRPDPGTGLPPVPRVDGALDVRVVWPTPGQGVPADSTFVFGSIGSGAAAVTVNGTPVRVAPNGAFLAYLPTPPADAPRYEVVATRGGETARRTVAVRVARRRAVVPGALAVDTASLTPRVRTYLPLTETVRVSVRASRGAAVWLETASPPPVPGVRLDAPAPSRLVRTPLVDAAAALGDSAGAPMPSWSGPPR